MIKENDPTFTKLEIWYQTGHDVPGIYWKGVGEAIGRNTNLKEVYI
jgi:hypothetical protein